MEKRNKKISCFTIDADLMRDFKIFSRIKKIPMSRYIEEAIVKILEDASFRIEEIPETKEETNDNIDKSIDDEDDLDEPTNI